MQHGCNPYLCSVLREPSKKFMLRLTFSTLLVVFSGLLVTVVGQNGYSVSGIILDQADKPVAEADVQLGETGRGTLSDDKGNFRLEGLRNGSYHLHISHVGFAPVTKEFIIDDKDVDLKVVLEVTALEIDEFVVEDALLKREDEKRSLTIESTNEEDLRKSGSSGLVQALEKIPGVSMINIGTGVAKPVIRGLSSNRVATTESGIKQEGQQWGSDHGLEIDPFRVGQVNVIKGPASLLYGSDAMGGVLQVLPPPLPPPNTLSGGLLLDGQTNTDLIGGSAYLEGQRKGWFFQGRYTQREYGDIKVPADSFRYNSFIIPVDDNRIKNTAGNDQGLTAMVGLNRSWGISRVTLSDYRQEIGFFPGAHGRPDPDAARDDGDSRNLEYPRQNINHFKAIWSSSVIYKENWLEVDLGMQRNHRQEKEDLGIVGDDNALDLLLHTYSANVRYHHVPSEEFNSVYGFSGNYKVNRIAGIDFLLPEFESLDAGAFTYQEWTANSDLTLNAGLRFDWGRVTVEEHLEPVFEDGVATGENFIRSAALERDFTSFSGGMGLAYNLNKQWSLKFNLGSSFRFPTVPELASNGTHHGAFRFESGNPDLESERGYQTDLNISWQKKNLLLRFTPYFNYFNNYIFLRPTGIFAVGQSGSGQIHQYTQSNAIHTGAELASDLHIVEHLHLGWSMEYIWAQNVDENRPLPLIPPATGRLELEYELEEIGALFQNVYFTLGPQISSAQERVERNESETEGYFLINAGFGGDVKVGSQLIRVFFRARNLTNENYLNHLSRYRLLNLPEAGRNFTLTLSFPFLIRSWDQ